MARKRYAPEVHELSGRYQKNPQYRPTNAPEYIPGAPEMPPEIAANPEAAEHWHNYCKIAAAAGTLTQADVFSLAIGSMCHSQIRHLFQKVSNGNVTKPDFKGRERKSPESTVLVQYLNIYMKWLSESGLTPASRSKVVATKPVGEEDPLADMIKRRMGVSAN